MIHNDIIIKALLSKNNTDLITTMQSYRMDSYDQTAMMQLYLYSPKLYHKCERKYDAWNKDIWTGETVKEILSTDLGLTKDEIDTIMNVCHKYILTEYNFIAQINEYNVWRMNHDFLFALHSENRLKRLNDIPIENLKIIAGDLQKYIDYETYRNLSDNEKSLYSLKEQHSVNSVKYTDLTYKEYKNELTSIKKVLDMLSNHIDNVSSISCNIYLDTSGNTTNASKMPIEISKKQADSELKIRETLSYNNKKHIANYIPFDKIDSDFHEMFKNINSSLYLTKVLSYEEAFDKIQEQYRPVYTHTLKQSVIDRVLKSVARKYLRSGSTLQLSEYEDEIISLSDSTNKSDLTKNTTISPSDYTTSVTYKKAKLELYPDKEVSNKDLLELLKTIYAGLNK